MAITRKQLGITTNLTTFVQVLSLHAISKIPINLKTAIAGATAGATRAETAADRPVWSTDLAVD
jgi:hypothetical protein